jgi:hypothetical protein
MIPAKKRTLDRSTTGILPDILPKKNPLPELKISGDKRYFLKSDGQDSRNLIECLHLCNGKNCEKGSMRAWHISGREM